MDLSATKQEELVVAKPGSSDQPKAAKRLNESYWSRLIPRSLGEILLAALVVLVICMHLKYLLEVRTTVPHGDEWSLLDGMFRSLDEHRVGAWVFHPRNGHFLIPGTLAYLVSLRLWSLDLAPLRMLNFPACLLAFALTAHVINAQVSSRFLRFYLFAGSSFLIFNLCLWEFFTMGYLFTAILATVFGGMGLYYLAKVVQSAAKWKNNLLTGLVFLIASVLSLGSGYAAVAAALCLLTFAGLKKLVLSHPIPGYKKIVHALAFGLAFLTVASHPFFHLKSRLIQIAFRTVLVAGSFGSSFLDRNILLAQNVAFICGLIVVGISLWIGVHFFLRESFSSRLLPVFSFGLILFGLLGCAAVGIARSFSNGEFLSSRYTLYPSICLLGILLYFAYSRVFLLINVWCFTAVGFLLGTVKEQQVAVYRPAVYAKIEDAMRNSDNLSDLQLRATLYWQENTKGVRRVVARMRRDRLNVFRGNANSNTLAR